KARRPTRSKDRGTRERLLECAASVFADQGYEDGSVRDVCRLAKANVAAINYHFGSKERLYVETVRWAMAIDRDEDTAELLSFAARDDLSPPDRLVGTIRRFSLGLLAPRPTWPIRLLMRELSTPTVAFDTIMRQYLAPRFSAMSRAVEAYLPDAD